MVFWVSCRSGGSSLCNSITRTAYLWMSDLTSPLWGWFRPAYSKANAKACTTNEIKKEDGPLRDGGGLSNSEMSEEDLMTE